MPKYRKELLAVIKGLTKSLTKAAAEQREAIVPPLEELLSVDLIKDKEAPAFDEAVRKHSEFWNKQAQIQGINLDKVDAADQTPLSELQQAAAELRVLMGMQAAADDVFIHILKHNPEECRAYIASKNLGNLPKALGLDKPGAEAILSDDAVIAIKAQAAVLILPKLISSSDNSQLLKELMDTNSKDARAVLQKLDVPGNGVDLLTDEVIGANLQRLQEQATKRYIPLAAQQHINSLDKSALAACEKMSKNELVASIGSALGISMTPAFSDEEYVRIRSTLTSRYLQEQIKSVTFNKPIDAALLNSANVEPIIEFIKSGIPLAAESQTVLKQAVSDNLPVFKALLAMHFIKSQKSDKSKDLTELAKAQGLPKFQATLGKLGVKPIEGIAAPELIAVQHAARNRLVSHSLNECSSLGIAAHPQFLKAFALLPPEQQLHLLADEQRTAFRALLEATKEDELKAVFKPRTSDAPIIADLVAENQRLASLKSLYNGALAEVIASVQPPVSLTKAQVASLNQALEKQPNMDGFIAAIEPIVGVNPQLIAAVTANKAHIADQHLANTEFRHIYYSEDSAQFFSAVQRSIAEVFLRLNVRASYFIPEVMAKELDTLLKLHHSSVKDFIHAVGQSTRIVKNPTQRDAVAHALALALPEASYATIQNERRAEIMRDPEQATQAVAEISLSLDNIKKNQKPALEAAPKLKSLIENEVFSADGEVMHFGPAFDDAVKKRPLEIKKEFELLLGQASRVVAHLEANKKLIQEHLSSLPAKPAKDQHIEKLRSNLKKDEKVVEATLEQYSKAEKYLSKMVKEINRVVGAKHEYLYNGANISHKVVSRADIERLRKEAKQLDKEQIKELSIEHKAAVKGIAVTKDLEQGELYLFEVMNKGKNDQLTKGSFSQTHGFDAVEVKKGEMLKIPTCRIEMIHPPEVVTAEKNPDNTITARPVPTDAKASAEDIANFYLSMATAMIVANGGKAPTKENPFRLSGGTTEQMECLWTALKVLGEESKLKFGEDAIIIETGSFVPDNVRSKGLFGTKFSPASVYETVFKDKGKFTACVESKINYVDQLAADAKKTTKALADASNNTSSFKGLLQGIKPASSSNSALKVLTTVADGLSAAAPAVDALSRLK